MLRKSILLLTLSAGLCGLSYSAQARPVSYADSWTVMLRNDADQNSLHIHYTFDRKHSIGARIRYDREGDFIFTGAQLNRLMQRWNAANSQANIYGRIAAGRVRDDASSQKDDAAYMLGLSGDWETRRYFISGETQYWDNGRYGDEISHHVRLGIAPYIAGTGALHTWVMIEGHNEPEADDPLSATALIRFFKGPSLLELGVDTDGEPMLNYIHRF